MSVDQNKLNAALAKQGGVNDNWPSLRTTHPHLFADNPAFVSAADMDAMAKAVATIEKLSKLQNFKDLALATAPPIAHQDFGPRGSLMGYDFHIAPDGPKLIEINTNAGGAFLNAVIVSAMQACCDEVDRAFFTRNPNAFSDHIISMVNAEWALQGLTRPLHHVVIVDDDPQSQYLYPEFKLAQALLERAGFLVTIADPSELNWDGTTLNHNGTKIDLVYNRLVDFMLQEPGHQALRKAYAAAVIDLFSRRVVGWSMSASMTAQLVTDALLMAIWRRGKPNALLHHSDQGSQYTGEPFRRLLEDNGVSCSMSRSGNVWDNAAMESFFSSLKTERTARKVYRSRAEAKADIFDYIERFYNPKLRHSTLGYLSPIEFERKAGLA